MKNKGFTLAEVLGVIIILGILVIVTFPPLLNQLKKSQGKLSEATKVLLGTQAGNYISDHPSSYPIVEKNVYCIKLKKLIDTGYSSSQSIDASTGEKIDEENTYIKYTIHGFNNYEYDVVEECTEERQ